MNSQKYEFGGLYISMILAGLIIMGIFVLFIALLWVFGLDLNEIMHSEGFPVFIIPIIWGISVLVLGFLLYPILKKKNWLTE